MKIPVPEGYTLPEDVADGDTMEELVTFRVEGDSLVPTMIAGVEIPTEEATMEEDMAVDEDVEDMEMGANPMAGMGERMLGMA